MKQRDFLYKKKYYSRIIKLFKAVAFYHIKPLRQNLFVLKQYLGGISKLLMLKIYFEGSLNSNRGIQYVTSICSVLGET